MAASKRRGRVEVEPEVSARRAGLVYVGDDAPGIRRDRAGKGFSYVGRGGRTVRDPRVLRRIAAIGIPPAWTEVWICPSPRGHIQATGIDGRRRKQYRYHEAWRKTRDRTKFHRMESFGRALPAIRKRVREDLGRDGLPREKVLATAVRLLDATYIRIGNVRYERENNSFGLTTMRDRHVEIASGTIRFEFRGKAGKTHAIDVRDARLARIVKECQEIPGQHLFQYLEDDGTPRPIASEDVNAYLEEVAGDEFTAKDFRTWAGTVIVAQTLRGIGLASSSTEAARNVVRAIEVAAIGLGNTVPVCRASYVHPAVIDGYLDGSLTRASRRRVQTGGAIRADRLKPEEAALLAFLRSTTSA